MGHDRRAQLAVGTDRHRLGVASESYEHAAIETMPLTRTIDPRTEDVCVAENPEVLGDIGLGEGQLSGDLSHGKWLALLEELNDLNAGRVAHRLGDCRHLLPGE